MKCDYLYICLYKYRIYETVTQWEVCPAHKEEESAYSQSLSATELGVSTRRIGKFYSLAEMQEIHTTVGLQCSQLYLS